MRPIKKKFRLQSSRSAASRSSLTPSIHSVSASSTYSDSIVKGKGTRAKARANDVSTTTGGTTTSSGVEKNKPKAKRPRSEIWDHFHKFINDSGDHKAHLKSCSKFPRTSSDPAQTELICTTNEEESSISFGKYSVEALRKAIAEMIIKDELPFKFVEAKGFRKCMLIACPRFKMPSHWTIARDCYDIYLDEKKNLNTLLHSHSFRVSLTTDTWTSLQRVNYMCLTCHFIDNDWKLHKRIINFCPITSHKGEDVGKAIEKCLRDWGTDNVFTITVDNASCNDVVV